MSIGGPGDGALGYVQKLGYFGYQLVLTSAGKGFSEEPLLTILDTAGNALLNIDPSWIKLKAGSSTNYEISHLRDLSPTAHRGLRGLEVAASQYSPRGFGCSYLFIFLLGLLS